MDKKQSTVIIFGVILVGLFVIAVIFFVRKYEKESLSPLAPAGKPVRVENAPAQPQRQEKAKFSDQTDNQFSTEKGKFLQ